MAGEAAIAQRKGSRPDGVGIGTSTKALPALQEPTVAVECAPNPFTAKVLPMCPEWTPVLFAG